MGRGDTDSGIPPEARNFQAPQDLKPEKIKQAQNSRDVFLIALNEQLIGMVESGILTAEQAKEKRTVADLFETGFSDDPRQDALEFSRVGTPGAPGEKEMIEMFEERGAERELATDEPLDEASPVADFLRVTQSAKRAYGERMRMDLPTAEKRELIQAILSNERVTEYFKSIVPRIKSGLTIEKIIERDRAEVQRKKKATGQEETFETTLRLAELAVQNAREKK